MKILHFSTHNELCGIGKFQEMFLDVFTQEEADGGAHNEFFDLSPNQTRVMSKPDFKKALKSLEQQLAGYDILHIQHEFSFYKDDEMMQIIALARRLKKKTVVTVHTSPDVVDTYINFGGLGPRSWLLYARKMRRKGWLKRSMIEPLKAADIVIVHNERTKQSLIGHGVKELQIRKVMMPIPQLSHAKKSTVITKELNVKPKDVVISTVGFLHRFKGIKEAVKSLSYLPDNYKLAIIGGLHKHTDDIKIYDEITDLVRDLGLIDRVYITGFIEDDEELNALIRETDICVYPYDREYYSNVSSAALNNAFANHVPPVAYPTDSFVEITNARPDCMTVTPSFSYYELARHTKSLTIKKAKEQAKLFAAEFSYPNVAQEIKKIYAELAGN